MRSWIVAAFVSFAEPAFACDDHHGGSCLIEGHAENCALFCEHSTAAKPGKPVRFQAIGHMVAPETIPGCASDGKPIPFQHKGMNGSKVVGRFSGKTSKKFVVEIVFKDGTTTVLQ